MHILISKNEYQNVSQLPALITDTTDQTVNGIDCKLGEITAASFASISNSLAEGSYSVSDGVILPSAVKNT
jgi:hypothetical protein